MINMVVISKRAEKHLRKVPIHVAAKLRIWIEALEVSGLRSMRQIPGYHDEPLKGRRRGQRSIRLSKAYRAVYEIRSDGAIEFVSVEEVIKHDY